MLNNLVIKIKMIEKSKKKKKVECKGFHPTALICRKSERASHGLNFTFWPLRL
jgi:hypothetical protein